MLKRRHVTRPLNVYSGDNLEGLTFLGTVALELPLRVVVPGQIKVDISAGATAAGIIFVNLAYVLRPEDDPRKSNGHISVIVGHPMVAKSLPGFVPSRTEDTERIPGFLESGKW